MAERFPHPASVPPSPTNTPRILTSFTFWPAGCAGNQRSHPRRMAPRPAFLFQEEKPGKYQDSGKPQVTLNTVLIWICKLLRGRILLTCTFQGPLWAKTSAFIITCTNSAMSYRPLIPTPFTITAIICLQNNSNSARAGNPGWVLSALHVSTRLIFTTIHGLCMTMIFRS